MEAVAETRLLMDGLASPNVKGLERLLAQKPKSDEVWTFARGQALLLAETGNLLLLRPPRNNGETVWTRRAVELRESAVVLGRHLGQRDFSKESHQLGACRQRVQSLPSQLPRAHAHQPLSRDGAASSRHGLRIKCKFPSTVA